MPRWLASGRSSRQPADQPDVVYAGVEPHALFRSDDRGESFSLVEGLWRHPDRPSWMPGGGGACLHTVLVASDRPRRCDGRDVGCGRLRTRDGGATWEPANRGIQSALRPRGSALSGVRTVRPQGGVPPGSPAAPVRPEPLRRLSQRGPRQLVDTDRDPDCRATSDSRWSPTRTGRTPCTRFPLQADAERFPPDAKLPGLPNARTPGQLGATVQTASRRIRTTPQSFATRWSPTLGTLRVSTSGHDLERSSRAVTTGTAGR